MPSRSPTQKQIRKIVNICKAFVTNKDRLLCELKLVAFFSCSLNPHDFSSTNRVNINHREKSDAKTTTFRPKLNILDLMAVLFGCGSRISSSS